MTRHRTNISLPPLPGAQPSRLGATACLTAAASVITTYENSGHAESRLCAGHRSGYRAGCSGRVLRGPLLERGLPEVSVGPVPQACEELAGGGEEPVKLGLTQVAEQVAGELGLVGGQGAGGSSALLGQLDQGGSPVAGVAGAGRQAGGFQGVEQDGDVAGGHSQRISQVRLISGASAGLGRIARMGMFLSGYLLAWAAVGAVAFAVLAGTGWLLTASPAAAKWLGVAIFIAAGIYQLTPWKDWCLRRCRSPIGALIYYAGFKGRGRDLRVGLHHGATCAGCCWGLMVVLVAVGVMNVAVMAALAAVIFAEKLGRYGKPFGLAAGVVLAAIGVLAIWFPWLLPGLHVAGMPAMPTR